MDYSMPVAKLLAVMNCIPSEIKQGATYKVLSSCTRHNRNSLADISITQISTHTTVTVLILSQSLFCKDKK